MKRLIVYAVALYLLVVPFAPAQTDISPMPSATPAAQSTPDAMNKMTEMCIQMMKNEKAAMPYIIGVSVLFAALLFIALVLFIVLEILWVKYWKRLLKAQNGSSVM